MDSSIYSTVMAITVTSLFFIADLALSIRNFSTRKFFCLDLGTAKTECVVEPMERSGQSPPYPCEAGRLLHSIVKSWRRCPGLRLIERESHVHVRTGDSPHARNPAPKVRLVQKQEGPYSTLMLDRLRGYAGIRQVVTLSGNP